MPPSRVSKLAMSSIQRPILSSQWQYKNSSANVDSIHTESSPASFDVAIIGGGITGLTAAFRAALRPNCRNVTIYESSFRLGGLIDSEVVPVDDKGRSIVFEYGPRTLRTGLTTNSSRFKSTTPLLELVFFFFFFLAGCLSVIILLMN